MCDTKKVETIKCLLVGDSQVGKSSLLQTLSTGKFPSDFVPSVYDTCSFYVDLKNVFKTSDGETVESTSPNGITEDYLNGFIVELWDSDVETKLNLDEFNIILLCFSLDNKKSFESIKTKWLNEIKNYNKAILINDDNEIENDINESEMGTLLNQVTARKCLSYLLVGLKGDTVISSATNSNTSLEIEDCSNDESEISNVSEDSLNGKYNLICDTENDIKNDENRLSPRQKSSRFSKIKIHPNKKRNQLTNENNNNVKSRENLENYYRKYAKKIGAYDYIELSAKTMNNAPLNNSNNNANESLIDFNCEYNTSDNSTSNNSNNNNSSIYLNELLEKLCETHYFNINSNSNTKVKRIIKLKKFLNKLNLKKSSNYDRLQSLTTLTTALNVNDVTQVEQSIPEETVVTQIETTNIPIVPQSETTPQTPCTLITEKNKNKTIKFKIGKLITQCKKYIFSCTSNRYTLDEDMNEDNRPIERSKIKKIPSSKCKRFELINSNSALDIIENDDVFYDW